MIDLTFAIEAEAVPVIIHRKSAGGYNIDGKWVGENSTPVNATATVQPGTGKRLMDLPEGERQSAKFVMWTRADIALDDEVEYSGKRYRISFLWPRPADGFNKAAMGMLR